MIKSRTKLIVLHPLLRDGKVVDGAFIDECGGSEPHYTRSSENGQVIYSHESGYGYLPASRVKIGAPREL